MPQNSGDFGLYIDDFNKRDLEHSRFKINKSFYTLYIVTEGEGVYESGQIRYKISTGSIFMTLAHQSCYIECEKEMSLMYIDFMGLRSVSLAKGLLDYSHRAVFDGYSFMIPLWKDALDGWNKIKSKLIAEGILLYTLGSIPGKGELKGQYRKREHISIQTYIRNNYNNCDLTLETVANSFGYNKKYLSDLFKTKFGISFTAFLKEVRLENAVSFMQLGSTSVNKIALRCGYADSLYFSKVFKEKYGVSPKKYMINLSASSDVNNESDK